MFLVVLLRHTGIIKVLRKIFKSVLCE